MSRFYAIAGLIVVFGISFVLCGEAPLKQCPGSNFENLRENADVSPCQKTKCKLYKQSNITVQFRFKTKSKVTSLTHDVRAIVIGGLELPFVGVDGSDACAGVTREGAPAPCPLEPDTEYQLTTVIPVEAFYPSISLTVHWALVDQKKQNLICFEVPAEIKEAKKSKVSTA